MKQKTPAKQSSSPSPSSDSLQGQLALDIYQTAKEIVILAPIAGVKLSDIAVTVTEDVLTIKGVRHAQFSVPDEDWFTQECFWGNFSRSVILPAAVDSTKINASFKDCVLRVTIPKTGGNQAKVIRITAPEI